MPNRRIPYIVIIPVAAFLVAAITYALARHALTLKGLILGLIAAAVIVLAATQMNRGPYI